MRGWERLPCPLAGAAGCLLGPCPGSAALGCRVLARALAGTVHPFATVRCLCDLATQKIQELEATLYDALQQEPGHKAGGALSAGQREDLQAAVEKVRRQILRQSREFDSQVLRERMELLQQAQQVRRPRALLAPLGLSVLAPAGLRGHLLGPQASQHPLGTLSLPLPITPHTPS